MACSRHCKDEFQVKKLKLTCDDHKYFVTCQWPIPPVFYVLYRVMVMFYFCIWTVEQFTRRRSEKILIFLTIQTYMSITLHLILSTVLSVGYLTVNCKRWKDLVRPNAAFLHSRSSAARRLSIAAAHHHMPLHFIYKISWALYTMICSASLVVTISYWSTIYPFLKGTPGHGLNLTNLNVHLFNAVYVAVDLLVSAVPVRLAHVYLPIVFATWYSAFYVVYWASGGTDMQGRSRIYAMIDFSSDPVRAAVGLVLLIFVSFPACHLIAWCIFKLRTILFRCVAVVERQDINLAEDNEAGAVNEGWTVELQSNGVRNVEATLNDTKL